MRPSTQPRRRTRLAGLLVLALSAACSSAPAEPARPPDPGATAGTDARAEQVDRLLTLSQVDNIVSARGPSFTRRVAFLAGDPTDAELERLVAAVREAFEPARLRADVQAAMLEEPDVGPIDQVLSWMEGGANAELRGIVDAYDPPTTIEDFAASLQPGDIQPARLEAMRRWAEVQGAGTFYVLLDQALEQAAFAVVEALRPGSPEFEPLAGEELTRTLDTSLRAATVTFLFRYQTVPDDLLARATDEFAGPSGQWYVEAYSLAVARAMRSAGQRVVAQLAGSG